MELWCCGYVDVWILKLWSYGVVELWSCVDVES